MDGGMQGWRDAGMDVGMEVGMGRGGGRDGCRDGGRDRACVLPVSFPSGQHRPGIGWVSRGLS